MREVVVTETLRCDFCGEKHTDMHPVVTRMFSWSGQEREIDLCPTDLKEVEHMFETLIEKGRRPEGSRRTRSNGRKAPYSGDTRFNQWYDSATQMFGCPADDCGRRFTSANGLAVHHSRKHGSLL